MLTATQFDTAFTKAIRKNYDNQTKEAIKNSAMNKIFHVQDSTEYTQSYTSNEGVAGPKYFNESGSLNQVDIGKGYKTTFDSAEFGEYLTISYKERLKARDNTLTLAGIVNNKKNGAIVSMYNFIEDESHKMLNDAFAGAQILAPDGNPLAYATHTWNSTGTTFSNLLSAAVLDNSVVDEVRKRGGEFVDSQGRKMPLTFKTLVVKTGSKAFTAAKKIFGDFTNSQLRVTTPSGINIYAGEFTIIETPRLTNGNSYHFLADAAMLGLENPLFVDFTDRPHMFDLIQEKNLDFVYPIAGSVKFGCRNLPFTMLSSAGA